MTSGLLEFQSNNLWLFFIIYIVITVILCNIEKPKDGVKYFVIGLVSFVVSMFVFAIFPALFIISLFGFAPYVCIKIYKKVKPIIEVLIKMFFN